MHTLTTADLTAAVESLRVLASPFEHVDVNQWRSAVLSRLRDLLAADAAGFLLPVPASPLFYSEEIAPEVLAAFPEYPPPPLIDGTPLEHRMLELGVGTVEQGYGDHFSRYLESPYYQEYAVPARALDTMAAVLRLPDNPIYETANLHFWHERTEGRRFGERELLLLRLLFPAFETGVTAVTRLYHLRAGLEASLEADADGAMIFGPEGRLLHRNPAAERISGTGSAERSLVAAGRTMARAWREERSPGVLEPGTLAREVATRVGCYELRSVLLPEGTFAFGPAVLVRIRAGRGPLPGPTALRERFDLTRRQAEVALLLAERLTNPEIAERLVISEYTVRSHVEAVMRKLGIHDRRETESVLRG